MIEIAKVVLAIYGILLIVGGIIGKAKHGSSASLFGGAISGIVVLIGFWQSLNDPAIGFLTGGLVGLLLAGIFMSRFVRTRKFMPAGLVLLLSLLVGILTMMARQEYLLNEDKLVGDLKKKGQEQCPGPTSKGSQPENQAFTSELKYSTFNLLSICVSPLPENVLRGECQYIGKPHQPVGAVT